MTNPLVFQTVSIEAVKRLAKVEGACVSVYLPSYQRGSSAAARSDVLLHSFVNQASEQLRLRGLSQTDIEDLLAPLQTFQAKDERLQYGHSEGLALFRAPGFFEAFLIPASVQPACFVEAAFQILPLLEVTSTPRDVWVLALVRKGVRLLRNGEPMPLPPGIPVIVDGTEVELTTKHFRDYCVAIDRALGVMFDGSNQPLVLAGAISELSIYRHIHTYAHLAPEGILRSPDDGVLSDAELAAQANAIVARNPSPSELLANAHIFGAMGSSRIVTELNALVQVASKGKVGEVFIATGLGEMGDVDHITGKVRLSGELVAANDDLYNAVAVETLNHSGEVFVVPPDRIPGGFAAVAALRY